MAERSRFGVNRIAPWKVAWWIVLVEGIIALAAGLYVLVQPQQASTWIAQLIGAYFLVNSWLAIYVGFFRFWGARRAAVPPGVVGGIGVVTGLLALAQPLLAAVDTLALFSACS